MSRMGSGCMGTVLCVDRFGRSAGERQDQIVGRHRHDVRQREPGVRHKMPDGGRAGVDSFACRHYKPFMNPLATELNAALAGTIAETLLSGLGRRRGAEEFAAQRAA